MCLSYLDADLSPGELASCAAAAAAPSSASLNLVAQKSAFVLAQSSLACPGSLCQKPARILIVGQKDVVIPFKELKVSTREGKDWLVLNRTKTN